jgi:hydroxyacylglutathione hydrolase
MQNDVTILSSYSDNYIYVVEYEPGLAFAVDPGQAEAVQEEIDRRQLSLTHVLITHRHADHTGGAKDLKKKTGCMVVAGAEKWFAGVDTALRDRQTLTVGQTRIRCITTPGHTAGSVCYFVSGGRLPAPVLFTGDTLFVCGCGRLLEADGETMWTSLRKLAALPDETLVYPGHDYMEENLRFALTEKPGDPELTARLDETHHKMSRHEPTVPSKLGDEKRLNPFLTAPDVQTFVRLRKQKDVF